MVLRDRPWCFYQLPNGFFLMTLKEVTIFITIILQTRLLKLREVRHKGTQPWRGGAGLSGFRVCVITHHAGCCCSVHMNRGTPNLPNKEKQKRATWQALSGLANSLWEPHLSPPQPRKFLPCLAYLFFYPGSSFSPPEAPLTPAWILVWTQLLGSERGMSFSDGSAVSS